MNHMIGMLSKHENDIQYLADITGDDELKLARSKDVAIDVTMTNLVRAYKFENQSFIADIIAPPRSVMSKIGRYKNRGKEAVNIDTSDLLSDRGVANEIGFGVSESTYYINPRGLCTFVSDDEADENGAIQCATEAVILLRAAVALRQEIRVRNLADATTFTATPSVNWDTSTAINLDVATAISAMKAKLGFRPTHLILPDHVGDAMIANTAIKNDIVTAMSVSDGRSYLETMTGSDIAKFKLWGIQPVVPDCMYNSAVPLNVSDTTHPVLSRVWGDDVFLVRIDGETRSMNWAFQFELLKPTIVRWRTENPGGTWFKILYKRVEKEVTPESIYKLVALLS